MKIKQTVLALGMAFTAAFSVPQKSEAVIIAAGMSDNPGFFALDFTDSALVNLAICVLVLPICALDEKITDSELNGTSSLIANGYSEAEASLIARDQKYLFNQLASKKLALKVAANDTIESLRSQLTPVAPGLSDSYLKFLVENR